MHVCERNDKEISSEEYSNHSDKPKQAEVSLYQSLTTVKRPT